jgi:mRNA interferase MazF
VRPAVAIQGNELLDAGTPIVVVLPLTTQVYPAFKLWRVTLPARDRLEETCQIVVDRPRALDRARFGDGPLTTLTEEEMAAVERSLRTVLGMY